MPTPLKWEIYYEDDSIVTSDSSAWEQAPAAGVLVVVQWFSETYPCYVDGLLEIRNYRNVWASPFDYFWMGADGLISAGFVADVPVNVFPKEGRWAEDETWIRIYNAAYARQAL